MKLVQLQHKITSDVMLELWELVPTWQMLLHRSVFTTLCRFVSLSLFVCLFIYEGHRKTIRLISTEPGGGVGDLFGLVDWTADANVDIRCVTGHKLSVSLRHINKPSHRSAVRCESHKQTLWCITSRGPTCCKHQTDGTPPLENLYVQLTLNINSGHDLWPLEQNASSALVGLFLPHIRPTDG